MVWIGPKFLSLECPVPLAGLWSTWIHNDYGSLLLFHHLTGTCQSFKVGLFVAVWFVEIIHECIYLYEHISSNFLYQFLIHIFVVILVNISPHDWLTLKSVRWLHDYTYQKFEDLKLFYFYSKHLRVPSFFLVIHMIADSPSQYFNLLTWPNISVHL